jgi:hypothetical protein
MSDSLTGDRSAPVPSPADPALDRRPLVAAGALLGLAALVTAGRLPVVFLSLSRPATPSASLVPEILGLVAALGIAAALWLVSGRRGICGASPTGRSALRVAAVVQVVVVVAALLPQGAWPAGRSLALVVVVLSLIGAVAALTGALVAARSDGLRRVAGRALVPWAAVALLRELLFSTSAGLALVVSAGGIGVSIGFQVVTVVALLVAAVVWLVAGLRTPAGAGVHAPSAHR